MPVLFHPVRIEGRAYLDGGILDRPGLEGMPTTEPRVLFHHISTRGVDPLPIRAGMVTLTIEGLPRANPFRLDEGRRALKVAREAARRALDRPIGDGLVVVGA